MRETEDQFDERLKTQKNHFETMITNLEDGIEKKLEAFNPNQAKRDL